MFQIVSSVITPHALFSPIILQSCSQFHESGSDNPSRDYSFQIFQDGVWPSWIWFKQKYEGRVLGLT